MNSSDGLYLASYVEQESSCLLEWVAYHRVRGAGKIKLWVSPASYKYLNLVHALAKNGVLSVEVLRSDAGVPLKTIGLLIVTDMQSGADLPCLILANNEYLSIGNSEQSFAKALCELGEDTTALSIPVTLNANGTAPQLTEEVRTLFKHGVYTGHNGEYPTAPRMGVNVECACAENVPASARNISKGVFAEVIRQDVQPEGKWFSEWKEQTRSEISRLLKVPEIAVAYDALQKNEEQMLDPSVADNDVKDEIFEEQITKKPDDPFTRVLEDPPPPWFVEIYPGGEQKGFVRSLEHHSLVLVERDVETLVVTFDNLSNVNDLSFGRVPWGYKFIKEQGHSHLGIMARRKDWYREPGLIDAMVELAEDGLFKRYKKVVFAGTSMGGFAALVFSSLAPGATALALSPQTTLNEAIVPWESRFGMGRMRNWKLPHGDAAFEIDDTKVFIISDPYHPLDQKHVDRLQGESVIKLKAWYSGHFSPVFLRRADLLQPVFAQAINGTLSEASFYKLYRSRRQLPWYRKSLEESLRAKGHLELAKRVGPAFVNAKRQQRTTTE